MTTREKLDLMDEINERNDERARNVPKAGDVETIHKTIEVYARGTLSSLDILAQYHGVDRGALLELLVNTMQAMQQTDEQEVD